MEVLISRCRTSGGLKELTVSSDESPIPCPKDVFQDMDWLRRSRIYSSTRNLDSSHSRAGLGVGSAGGGGDMQEARNLKILWKSKEQNKTQSGAHTSSLHTYIQICLEIKGIRGYGEMQKQSEIKPEGWACCHICFHQPWGGECRGGRRRSSKRHLSCSLHPHTLRCLVSGEAFPLGPRGETPPGCLLKAWGATLRREGKVVR